MSPAHCQPEQSKSDGYGPGEGCHNPCLLIEILVDLDATYAT